MLHSNVQALKSGRPWSSQMHNSPSRTADIVGSSRKAFATPDSPTTSSRCGRGGDRYLPVGDHFLVGHVDGSPSRDQSAGELQFSYKLAPLAGKFVQTAATEFSGKT